MRPRIFFGFLGLVLVGALLLGMRPNEGNPTSAQRVERIAGKVKCPTCQGLSVAQSGSASARSIRTVITEQVAAGRSDGEVLSYLVSRYGRSGLVVPEPRGVGALLWILPVLLFMLAASAVMRTVRRSGSRLTGTATDADRLLVDQARAARTAFGSGNGEDRP